MVKTLSNRLISESPKHNGNSKYKPNTEKIKSLNRMVVKSIEKIVDGSSLMPLT